MAKKTPDYWPCVPIYADDGIKLQSIIFTAFQRLDRKYPKYSSSGYAIERLVRQLACESDPTLLKRVGFDPERDMFCAYGDDADALLAIARLIRRATGQRKPPPSKRSAQLTPAQAQVALRRGYVEGLDAAAQREFLRGWPRPLDYEQRRLERELVARDPKTRLQAARLLHRAACGVIGNVREPLTHPTTFDAVRAALENERDPKVFDELAFTLSMMCRRACPDQRMQPVFESLLANPRWRVRWAAVEGLGALHAHDWSKLLPLLDDPHEEVRKEVCRAAWLAEGTICNWAVGHDPEIRKATPFPRAHIAKLEAKLKDKACRQFASNALQAIRTRSKARGRRV